MNGIAPHLHRISIAFAVVVLIENGLAQEPPQTATVEQQVAKFAEDLKSPDANHRAAARDGLAVIGAPAVPALVECAKNESELTRQCAVAALGAIGPVTEDVAPALVDALGDESRIVSEQAHGALRLVGVSALPTLLKRLEEVESPKHRERMVESIADYGPKAQDAVPLLIQALARLEDKPSNEDMYFREACARALGEIGPGHGAVVPTLIAALKSRYRSVREAAAHGLWGIGAPAKEAIPALLELLDSEDSMVVPAALGALCAIGVDADAAVPKFISLLDRRVFVSETANSLGTLGPAAAPAIPHLVTKLEDPVPGQRDGDIILALGHLGPEALPPLTKLLEDEKQVRRIWAAQALGKMGPAAASAIPRLEALLDDPDEQMQHAALEGLVGIGPAAHGVLEKAIHSGKTGSDFIVLLRGAGRTGIPLLIQAATDVGVSEGVRRTAARSLGELPGDATPDLIKLLETDDESQKVMIAEALGRIRPPAKDAIPALLAVTQNSSWYPSRVALSAMCSIDASDDRVIEACLDALLDPDEKYQATLVSWMSARAAEVMPHAIAKLESTSPGQRRGLEVLIAKYGAEAEEAVAALSSSSKEADRVSAAKILIAMTGEPLLRGTALERLLQDQSLSVRAVALEGLVAVGPVLQIPAKNVLPYLFAEDPATCESAGRVLGAIRPVGPDVVAGLGEALKRPEASIRNAAALGAQGLGAEARALVPALVKAFEIGDDRGRQNIARAFVAIGPEAGAAAQSLIKSVKAHVKSNGVDASVDIYPTGDEAERLIQYWNALLSVAPGSPEAMAYLGGVLMGIEYGGRYDVGSGAIVVALVGAGAPGLPYVTAYFERELSLASPPPRALDAFKVLGESGAPGAIAVLQAILANASVRADLRYEAGQALERILGPSEELKVQLANVASGGGTAGARPLKTLMTEYGCELIKEEIASEREGAHHYQFSLAFNEGNSRIPLGRQYADFEEGPYWQNGFDPESLSVHWLKESTLIQVKWTTFSVGGGHYTVDAVLLLGMVDGVWKELFRHSGEGHSRGGWMSNHTVTTSFTYDERLTLASRHDGWEYLDNPWPLAPPFLNNDDKTYYEFVFTETYEWPCEIAGDTITIQTGKHWISLTKHTFPLLEFARWMAGDANSGSPDSERISASISENLEKLKRLNPQFAEGETETGGVLLDDAVPPFVPFEGHLYQTND